MTDATPCLFWRESCIITITRYSNLQKHRHAAVEKEFCNIPTTVHPILSNLPREFLPRSCVKNNKTLGFGDRIGPCLQAEHKF